MGFKDWVADAPLSTLLVDGQSLTLRKNRIEFTPKGSFKKQTLPLEDAAVSIESGAEVDSRVTLTRVALIGVFALGAQKKTGGEQYLTVEGPDILWVLEVPRKKASDAKKFEMKFREAKAKL